MCVSVFFGHAYVQTMARHHHTCLAFDAYETVVVSVDEIHKKTTQLVKVLRSGG